MPVISSAQVTLKDGVTRNSTVITLAVNGWSNPLYYNLKIRALTGCATPRQLQRAES
ncbi:MAG: hypothetical protein Q7U76_10700 [Nitrospirota bacterium]|nr:hypothetical protein [Nitrospirota bacterium]